MNSTFLQDVRFESTGYKLVLSIRVQNELELLNNLFLVLTLIYNASVYYSTGSE